MKGIDKAIFGIGLTGYACVVAGGVLLPPRLGLLLARVVPISCSALLARRVAMSLASGGTAGCSCPACFTHLRPASRTLVRRALVFLVSGATASGPLSTVV